MGDKRVEMYHIKNESLDEHNGTIITKATVLQNEPRIKEEICSWEAKTTSDNELIISDIELCSIDHIDIGSDVGESDVYPFEDAGAFEAGGPLETSTWVKGELDIGPTEMRPVDMQYMLMPCKSDPVDEFPWRNENMGGSSELLEPCEEDLQEQLTRKAPSSQFTGKKIKNATVTEPQAAHSDITKFMVTCIEQQTHATRAPTPPPSQKTSRHDHINDSHTQRSNRSLNTVGNDTSKKFQCHDCHKIFPWKFMLLAHMPAHCRMLTKDSKFQCATCDKFFLRKGDLVVHLRIHTKERPYQCTVCNKTFRRGNAAKVHMLVHTKEQRYQCDVCEKKFSTKASLIVHLRVHTKECPFPCLLCDKRFSTREILAEHLRVHTKEQPYQCSTCDKIFRTQKILDVHVHMHTKERLYKCLTCDKRFSFPSSLSVHKRLHTRELLYQCTICDKKFDLPSVLKEHLREHSKEKMYLCTFCNKKFTHNYSRQSHERTHTGVKAKKLTYQCEICDKTIPSKRGLRSHYKRMHSKELLFECKKCQITFRNFKQLKCHRLESHNDKKHCTVGAKL